MSICTSDVLYMAYVNGRIVGRVKPNTTCVSFYNADTDWIMVLEAGRLSMRPYRPGVYRISP